MPAQRQLQEGVLLQFATLADGVEIAIFAVGVHDSVRGVVPVRHPPGDPLAASKAPRGSRLGTSSFNSRRIEPKAVCLPIGWTPAVYTS